MPGITPQGQGFHFEKRQAALKAHSRSRNAQVYVMLFSETVYAIWIQRNCKICKGTLLHPKQVVKEIIFKVAANCKDRDRQMLFLNIA